MPHRLDEGYGLNDEALATLASRGAELVITVDCGAASPREAATAKRLGLELIITDHHPFGAEMPEAAAIVHPLLPSELSGLPPYPFPGLCGAGVAFKLAWALCQQASQAKRVGERMKNFLVQALGLAAMGAVADVVPLGVVNGCFENRILVRHGLKSLKHQPTPGIEALLKVTKLAENSELSSEDIAFAIAPRLNAAGRLGQATLGVELLTTESPDRAQALAEYLHELNSSRESLERSVYLAASKQAQEFDLENDRALVLAGRGWHAGVIGIVAGRLAEKHHRPVIVISLDELGLKPGVGSARSVPGFDLHEALAECSSRLVSHGGHAAAAGLKIDAQWVEAFRGEFCEHAAGVLAGASPVAELRIDGETTLSMLTLESLSQMERLAPFGHGNPRPVLAVSDVELAEPPRKIGGGERHLSLKVRQHGAVMRGVAFGGGEWAEALAAVDGPLSLAFRPVINEFKGRRTVEMQVVDWRVSDSALTAGKGSIGSSAES